MTISIPITGGHAALVDDDCAHLLQYRWRLHVGRSGIRYAKRNLSIRGGKTAGAVYMHREIATPAPGLVVDHLDGDGLNNQRSNLQVTTQSVNMRNKVEATRRSRSGILGVSYYARIDRWAARIRVDGKNLHIGCFRTADEAMAARIAAEQTAWGAPPRRAPSHMALAAMLDG